ncbi:tetratricopeptide repeat protein [Rhizobium herbae]
MDSDLDSIGMMTRPATGRTMLVVLCLSFFSILSLGPVVAQSTAQPASEELAKSYRRLGQMYTEGKAVPRDLEKGVYYYRLAEQAGSDEARLTLAMMAYTDPGMGLDKAGALAHITALATQGQVPALSFLADIHAGLYGDAPDFELVLASLEEAADRGDVAAMIRIGDYYREGKVVGYDAAKAVAAYERAEVAGNRTVTEELAIFQAYGEGMSRDAAAAMARLESVKAQGRLSALVTEGDLMLTGGAPIVDVAGAIEAWNTAAAQGRVDAMIRLGDLYFYGLYGAQQMKKALAYYQAAADNGDLYGRLAFAKAQLARPTTAKDGQRQLESLAASGFDEAGVAIANAYLRGNGVPQNPKVGLSRLTDMAASGSIQARLRLIEIYRGGLVDGRRQVVRADAAKATALLDEIGPSLGKSERLHQEILLDAVSGKIGRPMQFIRRLDALPVTMRHRLVKDLRAEAPHLYLELVRLKLVDGGYLSLGQKGWKSVIGAMMAYCQDRGVRKVCAAGPFAPRTTAALQALF